MFRGCSRTLKTPNSPPLCIRKDKFAFCTFGERKNRKCCGKANCDCSDMTPRLFAMSISHFLTDDIKSRKSVLTSVLSISHFLGR